MVNTIRTAEGCLNEAPDNTLRLISPQDYRDFVVSAFGASLPFDPTPSDDAFNSAGHGFFDANSVWFNTLGINKAVWVCFDGAHNAADWRKVWPIPIPPPASLAENVCSVYWSTTTGVPSGLGPFGSSGFFLAAGQTIFIRHPFTPRPENGPWQAQVGTWNRPTWFTGTVPNARLIASGHQVDTLDPHDDILWIVTLTGGDIDSPIVVDTDLLDCDPCREFVGVTMPAEFTRNVIANNPEFIYAFDFDLELSHAVLVGPASGSPARPTFRLLVAGDIPPLGYLTTISVGLSMPGEFTVAGTPAGPTGTLAVTKVVQAANTVWAGPASGGSSQPGFRFLVSADIPALAYLTTIAVSLTMPGDFSVAGSPAGPTGTFAVTYTTQAANTFLAGPVSAGPSTPAYRIIAAPDLPIMQPSGGGHAPGATPDTPSSAGASLFLREDATWAAPGSPPGGSSFTKYNFDFTNQSGSSGTFALATLPSKAVVMSALIRITQQWAFPFTTTATLNLGWTGGQRPGAATGNYPGSITVITSGSPAPLSPNCILLAAGIAQNEGATAGTGLVVVFSGAGGTPTAGHVEIWVETATLP